VVVEATGGFESTTAAVLAWRWFAACRYKSGTGSPLRASLGKRAKTDPIDAKVIARFRRRR
jgi:transposase